MPNINQENFNKALEELKSDKLNMSKNESDAMLANILSTPISSPYAYGILSHFTVVSRVQLGVLSILIFTLSFGGVVYASDDSLPGDLLYPVKINVVEPILNVVNRAPDKKVVWEEEKVTRRIEEANALAKDDKLDDKKSEKLENEVRKSSEAFVSAVEDEDKEDDEKEKRKDEFRKKLEENDEEVVRNEIENENKEDEDRSEEKKDQKEKVKKIKDTAIKTLDKESNEKNKSKEGKRKDK